MHIINRGEHWHASPRFNLCQLIVKLHIKNWPVSSQTQERNKNIAVKAILKWEMEIMNEIMEVELRLRWLRCE